MNSRIINLLALVAMLTASCGMSAHAAEDGMPQMPVQALDSAVCKAIQNQVDEIVAISESPSMSDMEKIDTLQKSWAQSLANMQDKAQNDQEMGKIVQELARSVGMVMTMALSGYKGMNSPVPADATKALNDLKGQIKPYVSFMKLLCPDLIMPPSVAK